jgi:hypothetical protein
MFICCYPVSSITNTLSIKQPFSMLIFLGGQLGLRAAWDARKIFGRGQPEWSIVIYWHILQVSI